MMFIYFTCCFDCKDRENRGAGQGSVHWRPNISGHWAAPRIKWRTCASSPSPTRTCLPPSLKSVSGQTSVEGVTPAYTALEALCAVVLVETVVTAAAAMRTASRPLHGRSAALRADPLDFFLFRCHKCVFNQFSSSTIGTRSAMAHKSS